MSMHDETAGGAHVLKTGADALIRYGAYLVPCQVLALRASRPSERFQCHKTVRIKTPCLDLSTGDVVTSEAGNVLPASALLPNGAIADYIEIQDKQSAREFAFERGITVVPVEMAGGQYAGRVRYATDTQVLQLVGRDRAVIHDLAAFAEGFPIDEGLQAVVQYDEDGDGSAAPAPAYKP